MSQTRSHRRRTSSAAGHRRPFWARNDKSLQVYLENPRSKTQSTAPSSDYGVENFSYDHDHVKLWLTPDGLAERLPHQLLETLEDWQKACAALCTALERTEAFSTEAAHSAFPRGSRLPSEQAVVGAELSPCESLAVVIPRPMGMESPPYTPLDSFGCTTPLNVDSSMQKAALPDLTRINAELSPLSLPEDLQSVARYSHLNLDEIAWEYYCERLNEQIKDCQIALQRIKGYSRTTDILLFELRLILKPEVKLAIMDFDKCWASMQPKACALEERVAALEVPSLSEVTAMAMAASMGS